MRMYVLLGGACVLLGIWQTYTGDGDTGALWLFNAGTLLHFSRQEDK